MSMVDGCLVCEDAPTKKNPIATCIECGIKVHKLCYGIKYLPENWKCSPCELGATKSRSCQLCLAKGNPMKKTTCGNWVDVICALFTSGVTFSDKKTMEPIDIAQISKSKRNKLCTFCNTTKGYSGFCSHKGCKNRLHITCAQKNKALEEVVNPENDMISFNAYCKDHTPCDTGRLSSGSIEIIITKKQKAKLKKQGLSLDAAWLADDSVLSSKSFEKHAHKRTREWITLL